MSMIKHALAFVALAIAALISPAALLVPAGASAQPNADGAALYQSKCGGCHSIATNRIGPAHKGVFGRKAGAVVGYRYSPALKRAAIVWNDATLDRWLQDPQKVVMGSRMYLTVPDAAQRKAIIAYLKSPAAK
jgi:cytochrome c